MRASKSQIAAGCHELLTLRDAEIAQLRAEMQKKYNDDLVAHRWFARHFGEVMNGRDFAVKCPMATELICEQLRELQAARAVLTQAEETTQAEVITIWRVGAKVPVNVYDGDRPVCQCHSAADALRIVTAVNALKE